MSKLLKVRIFLLFAVAAVLTSVVIAATFAFLSDTETSTANTFDAGTLDLKIDNTSYYNGTISEDTTWKLDDLDGKLFFNFTDVKPGDWGEDTISIHVVNNDAWGCFESTATSDDDVSSNEPELLDGDLPENAQDTSDGELGDAINFVFWVDDGDNVLESDETDNIISQGTANQVLSNLKVVLADSLSSIFTPSPTPVAPLTGATTYYIAKAWCFGTLVLNPVVAGEGENPTVDGGITCDGSQLNNTSQTDAFTADIQFSAIQHRSNPNFTCYATPTPTNSPTPTPPVFSCTPNDVQFASSSSNNFQGLRKDGTSVLANRSVASAAFGAPQSLGLPVDGAVPVGSFFSLGFAHANNGNVPGNIVYGFTQPFFNGPGDDLQIFEVTGATNPAYPDEIVKVEVGSTSAGPWTVVAAAAIRDELIDINPVVSAQFVRLTEVSDVNLFSGTGDSTPDGYDLDAIRALCK